MVAPTTESEIKFEVWLPFEKWNGKFAGVGNGGWAGNISYGGLAEQIRRGYASASTNTGHDAAPGVNAARFAFEYPERLIDFAYRAHHETASIAKVLLQAYYGNAMDYDEASRVTWARIPHFYSTPYYVYQYATCFASSAQLMRQLTSGSEAERAAVIERYLTLLKSGGSDHPMPLLQRAGVDLSKPEPVRAVVDQLDALVTKLESAITNLK